MALKIMVVDDAAFMRIMLKELLKAGGYEFVIEAASGSEAVYMFKNYKPGLVIMDITMPEMDGITALSEIVKFDPHAKVIMCSAVGKQNTVISAIEAGARDFIVKPFQSDRVLQAIERSLLS
jgi:two-component system chemotaxis response regulator CheY